MKDPRIHKLATLLVEYCIDVQPNEPILIRAELETIPLLHAVYEKVLKAGGNPIIELIDDTFDELLFKHGNNQQLNFLSPAQQIYMETCAGLIGLRGKSNTRTLTNVDPKKQQLRQSAKSPLRKILSERAAKGELRWVATQFPVPAMAQEADMSLDEYEDFVYGACHVDKDDPVAEWQKLRAMQQILVDWLKGKKDVRVKGPNADLTLSIEGRTFINSDGRRNMPSGEIFTGPVESSVNGWVRFTYPSLVQGREVSGIELTFEEGKVVKASAKKNESFLMQVLNTDEGARYLGEFAIGTNYNIQQFTKSILFDEKIGGTMHMAVGRGYPETGSKNESAVHWDMICDMRDGSQIWVDDELLYENGQFVIL